ncbi:hypothetical protein CKM354_000628300 [Cercospora kikuchii]|uniref:C2H2-type domain-containing protein n=1 Tax=Cercospora kikuchii TaxID=84275 RepID=A0A9P3CHM1_9PEZI|nr:uncharacterized protein CKM354_000628300 [Cercospora kikuchii]GIZ43039.1 hypothetical protein CKM354_000628300 [Cercospora kikuchii]
MEADDATLAAILERTWTCLNQKTWKHPNFDRVFPEKQALQDAMETAELRFCPGLLDAINSDEPPSVEWFMNLPSATENGKVGDRVFGDYVLIFTKDGCPTLIYIGCGTESIYGLHSRMLKYDTNDVTSISQTVLDALRDGYTIAHKGKLIECDLPAARVRPIMSVLFLATEAMCQFTFWALRSLKKDYGMGACCPWARDTGLFSYRGLNTRGSLVEGINGNLGLSADELAAAADELRLAKNARKQAYRKANPDVISDTQKRSAQKAKRLRKFYCGLCNVAFEKQFKLDIHLQCTKHLTIVAEQAAGTLDFAKYKCPFCDYTSRKAPAMSNHKRRQHGCGRG